MNSPVFLPRTLGIELVRGCNFACEMCPVTSNAPAEPEKFQFINLTFLEELVAELDRWPSIQTIWFFHFGEPMAHPHYRQCLEILNRSAVARNALVIQHTNASLLRGDKAEAILDIPVIKRLVFSFDGYGDRESYQRLRGPHYEQVLENIRSFSARARQRRPELQLVTCTILPRDGEVPGLSNPGRDQALRQLSELFAPLGVQPEVRDMHNYSGNDDLKIAGRPPDRVAGGCSFVEDNSLYFTVNGFAQPCCAVYNETFNIGRFPAQSFGALLNSKKMRWLRHKLRMDQRQGVPFCKNCSLSLAQLGAENLRKFWLAADERGEVTELAERKYIFGNLVPTPHRVWRLDLGCGSTKAAGFIGVDRFALAGVDIVADLDHPLPFADNSVDLVFASHSLEHVHDLLATMREIYRICKHGAQVCIVAPYGQQALNLANPYHQQIFNEHTPRFWTSSPTTPLDTAEYFHPHAFSWGLAESDQSRATLDLRCLRIEFFYFPEYRSLAPEAQRAARKKYSDVCDQLMYHLVVVKQPVSEAEMNEFARTMDYYDPPYVALRRAREQNERLEAEMKQLKSALAECERELNELRQAHTRELAAAQAAHQQELAAAQATHQQELAAARAVQQSVEARYNRLLQAGQQLSQEANALRDSRWAQLRLRLRPQSEDLSTQVAPAFQQLKDDSLIFQDIRGYALRLSRDLRACEYIGYPLTLAQPGLTAVLLAPVLDWPAAQGVLGLELVSPDIRIIAHLTAPLAQLPENKPMRFDFPPLPASALGVFELRIFVRETAVPVRVFEWQKYSLGGLGKLRRRAFCGLIFA